MKKSFIAALALGVVVSTSAYAEGSEVSFVPSVSFGLRTLSFENSLGNQDGKIEDSFGNLNLGGALTYKKFYVAGSYDTSLLTNPVQSSVDQADPISDLCRYDWSLTGGYGYYSTDNHSFSAFAGYKFGETEMEPVTAPAGQQDGYKLTYEESGFFIGHSYSYYVESYGSLSLSVAYAWMDGTFTDNDDSATRYRYEGDAAGFSLGAKWTGFINNNVAYTFDIKNQMYTFDGSLNSTNALLATEVSFDESITTTAFGMTFYF